MKKAWENLSCSIPHRSLVSPSGLSGVTLIKHRAKSILKEEFSLAPQFSKIDIEALLKAQSSALRIILVGSHRDYMEQCAFYLASIVAKEEGPVSFQVAPTGKAWGKLPSMAIEIEDEDEEDEDEGYPLLLTHAKLVLPPQKEGSKEAEKLAIDNCSLSGLYVALEKDDILEKRLVEEVICGIKKSTYDSFPHIFFALEETQLSRELSLELQLNYNFAICHVGKASDDYLEEMFHSFTEELDIKTRNNPLVHAPTIIKALQKSRGEAFKQSDLHSLSLKYLRMDKEKNDCETADFLFSPVALNHDASAKDSLEAMIGLEGIKDRAKRLLAMDKLQSHRKDLGLDASPRHRHMAFSGAPGTGKTHCAKLLAKLLQEEGSGSGLFLEAGREDIIGKFVGHTAPKVAKLFEKARGGVLFLDEIGALNSSFEGDSYAQEAIDALVYHMDRNPETMVIFATYPHEMERFFESNPGLASRMSITLHFPSYEEATLLEILKSMAKKQGYTLTTGALKQSALYFSQKRKENPENFGNGREVRRLFHNAEEELALNLMDEEATAMTITSAHIKTATGRLLSPKKERRLIGFAG